MKGLIIVLLLLSGFLTTNGQDKRIKANNNLYERAEEYFNAGNYSKAIPIYETLEVRGSNTAIRRLGDCYRMINDLETAGTYYAIAVEQKNLNPVYYYYYGQTLLNSGHYPEAKNYFEKYMTFEPDSKMGTHMINACEFALADKKSASTVTLLSLDLNTPTAEFGPSYHQNGIVYASSNMTGPMRRRDDYTNAGFLNMYYKDLTSDTDNAHGEPLRGAINTSNFHDGPSCFSSDGNTIYFSRNNIGKLRAKGSRSGESKLKLYSATWSGDQFKDPIELSFNGNEYSCAHPSVNSDGTILYFSSDLSGGHGGADIYYSLMDTATQNWTWPVNAGPEINTDKDEYFPFIHVDGTLYFASNGHLGYGGLDIFASRALDDTGLNFGEAHNLGRPINSSADDFSFITDASKGNGFFASNRSGGMGSDDIYRFTGNPIPGK